MTAATMSKIILVLVLATICQLGTMGEEEKKRTLDSLAGSDFFKKSLDSLFGNDFFKREDEKRTLDALAGSDFFKKSLDSVAGNDFFKRRYVSSPFINKGISYRQRYHPSTVYDRFLAIHKPNRYI